MTITLTTMKRTLVLFAAIMAVLVSASFSMAAKPAHAGATYTVNTTGDQADLSPGDGVCKSGSGFGDLCTLRAAIQEANATEGADAIHFNIPNIFGEGVKTIKPASQLPTITE